MAKNNFKEFVKKYRLFLIIFLTVIIVLIFGITIYIKINKEKIKIAKNNKQEIIANTEKELIDRDTFEDLLFDNISLIYKDGYSYFSADVKSTGNTEITISDVNIVLKDKDGNPVITLRGNISKSNANKSVGSITSSTKGKLNGVVSKEIIKYENTAQN